MVNVLSGHLLNIGKFFILCFVESVIEGLYGSVLKNRQHYRIYRFMFKNVFHYNGLRKGDCLLNILFCGDSGVIDGIILSSLSFCKNTKETLCFYILTAEVAGHTAIPKSFAGKLQEAVREKNVNNKVFLLDITEMFKNELPIANIKTRFTPLCMLRLFADLVTEIPDKILYTDADVLCRSDFSSMYYLNMSDSEIAGVPDRYGKWFFGNILRHNYLNSGVLLMNMSNIRQSGLFSKCRTMCRDKRMFMPDQSALNKLAVKRKLPERYNCQGKIKQDTVFKHFTTYFHFFPFIRAVTIKPWQTDKLHNELGIFEFDDILEEYERINNNEQRNTCIFHN